MTRVHRVPVRRLAKPVQPRSCSSRGAHLLFFKPLADRFARDAEDALQAAQRRTFFVGGEDLFFFGFGIAARLWIIATATVAVVTPITLFAIGRKPITY